jgi:hypothetical protein
MRNFVAFNLGQNGIKRSSAWSAVCPNAPYCCVNRVGWHYRHHKVFNVCTALFCSSFLLAPFVFGQCRLGQCRIH